jgi:hypothetical protein
MICRIERITTVVFEKESGRGKVIKGFGVCSS